MIRKLLGDVKFFQFLLAIDRDFLEQARLGSCPYCGAPLYRSDYPRKPRGGPESAEKEYGRRFSLCCSRDGCRKRLTPPSVRFLGRKVYVAAAVVIVTVMMHGETPARLEKLREIVGADPRTIDRWKNWWREPFAAGPFWKSSTSRFDRPVDEGGLPASLFERFAGSLQDKLASLLKFISPITTRSSPENLAFRGSA